jgi:hypothetical protein
MALKQILRYLKILNENFVKFSKFHNFAFVVFQNFHNKFGLFLTWGILVS